MTYVDYAIYYTLHNIAIIKRTISKSNPFNNLKKTLRTTTHKHHHDKSLANQVGQTLACRSASTPRIDIQHKKIKGESGDFKLTVLFMQLIKLK